MISPRLLRPKASGVVPWYLAGGVDIANCIAAYQPKGATSYAASLVNLAHPGTNDATAAAGADPGWSAAAGWDGATGKYLKTGITGTIGVMTAIVRYTNAASTETPFGTTQSNAFFAIVPNYGTTSVYFLIIAATRVIATPSVNGVAAIAGLQGYLDGAASGAAVTGTSLTSVELYVMGANNGAGTASRFEGQVQAIAFYSTTLTGPQIAAITTAMNAL